MIMMKLTVIGGGGVRAVFLAKAIVSKAKGLNIDEVVLMDNNAEKLRIYGNLAKGAAKSIDPSINFKITTDPIKALMDADIIITAIRVGEDQGRIFDERIALNHGVTGQETTGAGGFAMALRSIPAILEYCKLAKKYAKPDALFFNFTNPSGLVTQALRSEGFNNVYGICDFASAFIKEIGAVIGESPKDISVECLGLNHLSYFRSVKVRGEEKINELISNPLLYEKTEERLFNPELVKNLGMLLNGYLYFYYFREEAIKNINLSEKTRGETIKEINDAMFEELSQVDIENDFDNALSIYFKYITMREKSYMAIESHQEDEEKKNLNLTLSQLDDEGYAGVALRFVQAKVLNQPVEMILSVPNQGSINGLEAEDVIEVTCRIDKNGATPIKIGDIPEVQMSLIRQIKLYERLTVKAIKEKDRNIAKLALTVHPLVNSYSIASKLVDEYLEAHKTYVGEWR
jgi:6-phospho-beta-glucosidase